MTKTHICTILITAIMLTPISTAYGGTDTDKQMFIGQLTALISYIEQTFNLGDYQTPLSNTEMRDIIIEGTEWLVESQEESGHFEYEYLPYEDEYLDDDNIVRQAGALFALGEVARRDRVHTIDLSETIESSISFFDKLSPSNVYDGRTLRCVTRDENSITCKLGATSLALSGILGYVEANPEKANRYNDLIESYVSFILAAKKQDTGFRDRYRIGLGFSGEKESSFSNGEAILALVRYHQFNPRTDVKDVIDDTFDYLKNKEFDTSLYLWIMAALKDMNKLWPNEEYVSYTKEYTAWRIGRITQYKNTKKNYCASTEGFVSAYSVLEDNSTKDELASLREEIDFWNKKNSRLQIGGIDTHRLVAKDDILVFEIIQNMKRALGGFLTGDEILTQRIDFTQHCISTYIQTLVDIEGQTL